MNINWRDSKGRLTVVLTVVAAAGLLVGIVAWARVPKSSTKSPVASKKTVSDHAHDHDHHKGHAHQHGDHQHGSKKGHQHAHDDHDHPGHVEANAVELSEHAQQNIGLKLQTIKLQSFERTISVPGIVKERPGRSQTHVTAPMTGIVIDVFRIEGEAVEPGTPLFKLRLTHEDLVQAQTEFLRTLEELDVIHKEVERLEKVAAGGAVAGKTVLEKRYEQQKQQAFLRAQRQALLLHGLTDAQIDDIVRQRKLLQDLTVKSPADAADRQSSTARLFQVQDLKVEKGQHVNAGDLLCVLAEHQVLYIEGTAFEQDVEAINRAAKSSAKVTALLESQNERSIAVEGLQILYLANRIEPDSRAFHFYVVLPNSILRDMKTEEGHRFVYWRFKPGQRLQLLIPVETWRNRIVLPAEAVVHDGAESYVFLKYRDHFDRRTVHVEHRDWRWSVIADDGSLKPGDVVSISGAQQMHITLKNKAGGGVDPHAGHTH